MRLKASTRVTIKTGGKLHKLELIPQPWKGRYWLRYNGKNSDKIPACTITSLMNECRKIIVKGESCVSNSLNTK